MVCRRRRRLDAVVSLSLAICSIQWLVWPDSSFVPSCYDACFELKKVNLDWKSAVRGFLFSFLAP